MALTKTKRCVELRRRLSREQYTQKRYTFARRNRLTDTGLARTFTANTILYYLGQALVTRDSYTHSFNDDDSHTRIIYSSFYTASKRRSVPFNMAKRRIEHREQERALTL